MAERSEAKSAKRGFASKIRFENVSREASLRAFSFATLSLYRRIFSGQLIGHYIRSDLINLI